MIISRKLNLILVLVILSLTGWAQSFEGKIVFKNKYKSKIDGVSDQQFTAMMGDTQEYFLKDGNYKSVFNGSMLQWQLYLNKDNKLYNKLGNSAKILYNDGAVNNDEIVKKEVNKNATTILGYSCDELVLTCKSGIQKYYFTEKIRIDSKLFSAHKFGNWNEVMAVTGAMPIKIVIENAQFMIEATAAEITPMKLDAAMFQLPAGAELEKSPY